MRTENGLSLDIAAIKLHSLDRKNIHLPYTGPLGNGVPAPDAYIYINVQLVQGVRLVLSATSPAGGTVKMPLTAPMEEIISLMDAFTNQPAGRTGSGLSDYWHGLWLAHYIEWRKIATQPDRLLEIISSLPDHARQLLRDRIGAV